MSLGWILGTLGVLPADDALEIEWRTRRPAGVWGRIESDLRGERTPNSGNGEVTMKMKPLVTTLTGSTTKCLVTIVASMGTAAQSLVCGSAILRDVEVVTSRVPQSTITSVQKKPENGKRPGEREVDVYTTPTERQTKTYLVTVRLNDLVYTGQSSGNWFWDFDPTQLVINDPIGACISKGTLRLRRPDGKDYKTKIVHVVRDVAREPTQGGPDRW
jgi:hypothetical protein